MRGVTALHEARLHIVVISTHTPHAGSDVVQLDEPAALRISTHTPHAGSDIEFSRKFRADMISTHTPHAGSDHKMVEYCVVYGDFNPHSPCGE